MAKMLEGVFTRLELRRLVMSDQEWDVRMLSDRDSDKLFHKGKFDNDINSPAQTAESSSVNLCD